MTKLEAIVYEILIDHSLNTEQKGESISEYFTDLLENLYEDNDCRYDHHGYCQSHFWFETEPQCPQKTVKELLAESA